MSWIGFDLYAPGLTRWERNEKMIFVVDPGMSVLACYMCLFSSLIRLPGRGAPAILAVLWVGGSLAKFFPQYSPGKTGLKDLIAGFSTTRDFPSHINTEVPESIH